MTAKTLRSILAHVPDDTEMIAMIDGYESILDALVIPGAVLLGSTMMTDVLDTDTGQLLDPVEAHTTCLASMQKMKNTAGIREDH